MQRPLRVLLVEHSETDAGAVVSELRRSEYGVSCDRVESPDALRAALEQGPWELVISDFHLPRFTGLDALILTKEIDPDLPFIIVSGSMTEDEAVVLLQQGAEDCVMKDHLGRLRPAVVRALREGEERRVLRDTEEKLRRSEERYRELVESANDIVFMVDLQGNFTALNHAGEQISGYSREEVVRMNMAQVLTPESLQRAVQMIQQKLADNRPTTYELEMVAKEGHHVPLEVSTRLIAHDGVPAGVMGIARDVTERRHAEEALRESEARYRGLFENASDIVYTHDLKGNFTSINIASERVTGYSRDEVLAMNIADVVAPEDIELARRMISRKLQETTPTAYELEIVRKDGRRVSLEINSQLIYAGGLPVGVQGIARDVTERRRAEEELRARSRKQAAVAEIGQKALATADVNDLFRDAVNCVAETLDVDLSAVAALLPDGSALLLRAGVGWKKGLVGRALVGAGLHSQAGYALLSSEPVIVEDLRDETRFQPPAVLKEHGIVSGVSVIIHAQQTPFGTLSVFTKRERIFTQDDINFLQAVANVLATAIDRKRLEEERAQHNKALATRILQAQEEERKRISRELHDETAQSLSTLLMNLDLLEPRIPKEAHELKSGFKRVRTLARRTLDETRALSHDLRPTILDDVGLTAALQWFADEYEKSYGKRVEVRAQPQPPGRLSPEIEVALFRIAQEALTNTGKYADAEQIRLSLTFPNGVARLVVEDNGKGFDPSRVRGPTREGRLGLYGMNERAALLGGQLDIDAAPGKGTRVSVELPLAEGMTVNGSRSAHGE